MSLFKQVIVLVIAAVVIAVIALLWAWGASKNEDEACGMSCADCQKDDCTKRMS